MALSESVQRARDQYDQKLRIVARFKVDITPPEIQPVGNVLWVQRDFVQSNDYNPNFVAPPELKLLKVSILTDGWTQPIVCRQVIKEITGGTEEDPVEVDAFSHYEVVDGFHRWVISGDPQVYAMTDGKVPISIVVPRSEENQMMSTVRHNRARGSHHVLGMADIVATLVGNGVSEEEVATLLQMESEEIERLLDRGDMLKRGSAEEFGKGWVPR